MELKSILGGLILLFIIYYGSVKIGEVVTFIGVSIFVGLVLYTEGYYDLIGSAIASVVILLTLLILYVVVMKIRKIL